MTHEAFNQFCAALPATSHVVQWRGAHVWKVGGKVFAIGTSVDDRPAFTFKTALGDFDVLCQIPGVRPAPYFASRAMSWLQHHGARGLPDALLLEQIRSSHQLVSLGLTKKLQRELGLNQPG